MSPAGSNRMGNKPRSRRNAADIASVMRFRRSLTRRALRISRQPALNPFRAYTGHMTKPAPAAELRVLPAAPDLTAAVVAWLQRLALERRLSRARSRLTAATPGNISLFWRSVSARRPASPISPSAPPAICVPFSLIGGRKGSRAARCSARSPPSNRSPAISRAKAGKQPRRLGLSARPRRGDACPDR